MTFDPPSFLFDSSGFGATVDRVVADVSPTFTPADVVARGHDQTWQGISLREGALYLPRNAPIVGDLSISLRDLLVGIPPSEHGLQGEAVIEFGRTPVNPTVVEFLAIVDGEAQSVGIEANAAGYTLVSLPGAAVEAKATLRQSVAELPADATVNWVLPDGTRRDDAPTTGWFTAHAGESMRATFTELVGDERIPGEEQVYVFTLAASGGVEPADLPTITLGAGATTIERVASVSGSAAALGGIRGRPSSSTATPPMRRGSWATAPPPRRAPARRSHPRVATLALGRHDLVLRHGDRRAALRGAGARRRRPDRRRRRRTARRRRRGAGGQPDPRHLRPGDLRPRRPAGRQRARGGVRRRRRGGRARPAALAHVTIGTERLVPPELRHVQVLMLFNQATAAPDLFQRPDGTFVDAPTHVGRVGRLVRRRRWQFLVIGRCCDLGSDAYNDDLATQRAAAGGDVDRRHRSSIRSEQDPPGRADRRRSRRTPWPPGCSPTTRPTPTGSSRPCTARSPAPTRRPRHGRSSAASTCYAVGGEPTDATPAAHGELMPRPEQREALLPGDDAPTPVPPRRATPSCRSGPRLTIGWDSPSVHEPADAVPTLAELLLEWPASRSHDPRRRDDPVTPAPNDPTTEVFTLVGRWTHDPQSGQTMFTLSWDSSGDPTGWPTSTARCWRSCSPSARH